MNKSILGICALAVLAMADADIKTKGDVVYSIDGAQSTATKAKEGSVIEYKSGDGKLSIKDDVANKSIILKSQNQKYQVAKSTSIFSFNGIKAYFAKVETDNKGAFTRADGKCETLNIKKGTLTLTQDVKFIRYYQNNDLITEFQVENSKIAKQDKVNIKPKKGDIVRLLDKDGYDLYCLEIE